MAGQIHPRCNRVQVLAQQRALALLPGQLAGPDVQVACGQLREQLCARRADLGRSPDLGTPGLESGRIRGARRPVDDCLTAGGVRGIDMDGQAHPGIEPRRPTTGRDRAQKPGFSRQGLKR